MTKAAKARAPRSLPISAERREAVMVLVRAGELKVSEAATMLGLHYATVRRQARKMGFDPKQARKAYLEELKKHASDYAALFDIMYGDRAT
jgi:transposase